MRKKLWITFALILVLALVCGLIDWPRFPAKWKLGWFTKQKIHLGLDLQGGTQLVYAADTSQLPEEASKTTAVEGVRDVIERRVNVWGVTEPMVQTTRVGNDWRVIIELPGVEDVNEAINMIGETPLLEFKEQNPNPQPELTPEQTEEMAEYNSKAKTRAEEILKMALESEADFAALAREYSEDPGSRDKGGDLGWFSRGMMVAPFEEAVFDELKKGEITKELVQSGFGYHIIYKMDEREKEGDISVEIEEGGEGGEIEIVAELEVNASHILIRTKSEQDYIGPEDAWINTGLSGRQLVGARVDFDQQTGAAQVGLEFSDEGKNLFAEITKRNIGQPVAIFLDGQPISIPTVQEEISGGRAVITGKFNLKEAKLLAQRLNAGALEVPITLISQQNVGPNLGRSSVEKSFLAGIIGLILVAIFMIIFYRLPGLLAVFALAIYGLIVMALFKLIPVTLTLAGVAGFILSIGMAVDANVLIFERMREELRVGRDKLSAIDEGFRRAWPSIRDGNVSTLITCFILYYFGTSMVKGFGLTLGIGILVSMFSAIVITKTFLKLSAKKG